MSIQLFVPKFRIDECLAAIRECLEKGWTGLGFKTATMEEEWKTYTGLPNAHFLSSNTVGLHLAVELYKTKFGWSDEDEVITTPLTFISTNHAILYAGMKPVFADVDASLCLDPESVIERITPKTKALIFVGIGGNIGQYQKIVEICKEHDIKLILDAAHMAGTRVNGKHVGQEADCVVFSFQAVKNLPTADSGMICFKSKEDDERVRKLSWLGINKDTFARTAAQGAYKWMYDVEELGYKYHGNSIMAAMGLVQLKYLDLDNAYRRQLASWYRENLAGQTKIDIVNVTPGCESSTHLLQIRVKDRDALMLALNEHQIYPGVHYRDNTEYSMYSFGAGTCPNAAKASQEILSLPMHLGLTRADVDTVCELLIRYAK
ncbi:MULTISPECIES: DegT/DnrJ/EryC1/StrS family aminotransferase [Pseudomonas]|uniref:Putative DegT/DnrJ/EryC1/StrS aminotransferase n=1 Tax=Pseudomonas fluorescens (strain Pf0-1) TaxID=205922 RepID=Q3K8V5_PSEPF|nr:MULTISPECIES: DegT/DnrJ/EryC1/StrS family aminotransferase [Pseudomonas]ABA75799.1 putative DegT/DnrJ/EryC1/StrS aminotransferase [Pseudomonas fluorescens Pf0-1]MBL0793599.1 DegT/DnrJ/EryC1/StrS family aminotransferase [Pseudomonas sp. B7]MBX8625627.1 DegT/DnrJ/EryC1/StrS family aminotransferase [Pseudomonas glycinae]MBY9025379.1 DegT/DnrJ/EryC1/StrS family aminotransferase [Pseudomonas fluorescens]MBY9031767.1 DegT/DnrJ/EryC1/StrS family aminotransferase [Pseudomonas fluorescens]